MAGQVAFAAKRVSTCLRALPGLMPPPQADSTRRLKQVWVNVSMEVTSRGQPIAPLDRRYSISAWVSPSSSKTISVSTPGCDGGVSGRAGVRPKRGAGHASSRTTEVVYRRELWPVLTTGAEVMDTTSGHKRSTARNRQEPACSASELARWKTIGQPALPNDAKWHAGEEASRGK